jgi:hypothetical protein
MRRHRDAADLPVRGAAATSATDAAARIAGSRIPARRSGKMPSQAGGQDDKDNNNALPAPLQSN